MRPGVLRKLGEGLRAAQAGAEQIKRASEIFSELAATGDLCAYQDLESVSVEDEAKAAGTGIAGPAH